MAVATLAPLMLLADATSQPTTQGAAGDTGWLWHFGIAVLVALAVAWFAIARRSRVDKFLKESRSRRRAVSLVLILATPLFAVLIDRGALASIFGQGKATLTGWDKFSFIVGVPLLIFYATLAFLSLRHEDSWNERLSEAEGKLAKEIAAREKLERALQFSVGVCKTFLRVVVGFKADRLRELVESQAGGAITPAKLRNAFKPPDQLLKIAMAVFEVYRDRLIDGKRLRVAYFQKHEDLRENRLHLLHCWNGSSDKCIQSPHRKWKDRFKLDASDCLAVWVARTGQMAIVPDAEAAEKQMDHPFKFFYKEQAHKIRSIVALPLRREGDEAPFEHILVIDTDQVGFFSPSLEEHAELELLGENVAQRVRLEVDLSRLLKAPKEGSRS